MSLMYKDKLIANVSGGVVISKKIVLPSSAWVNGMQTVSVEGVTANEDTQLIQPVPDLASQNAYYDSGIICTGQSEGSLTFTAEETPKVDLTVYVVMQEVAI